MKGRKALIVLIMLLLVVSSAIGCTKKEPQDDRVKIVMWHTLADQHEAALLKLISDFNKSQDKYNLVAEQQTYGEIEAKLMQAVRNGTGPDIVSSFPTQAIGYIADGFLVDFAPYVNDPEIGIPNYKSMISAGLYAEISQWGEEEMYIFPLSGTGEVLFYNKTWFAELGIEEPKTWADIEAYSKLIYKEKGVPGFGTDSATDTFLCLIKQAGSDYIDAEKAVINIDKAIAVEKLNWFAKGVKEGYFRLVGEDMYFSNPFGSQAIGSYIGSSAGVSYVFAAVGDKFEVGCVPLPQDGKMKYINSWVSGYVCMSTDEVKARGVFEFLKFYIQEDVIMTWAEQFGSVPYYLDILETDRFKKFADTNIAIKALAAQMQYGGFLPSIWGTNTVRKEIDKMIQNVALGLMTAEAAFDEFVKNANEAMKK